MSWGSGGQKGNTGTMEKESEYRALICEEAGPTELRGCAPENIHRRRDRVAA